MSLELNTPPIKVKLSKSELNEFWLYLLNCDKYGFSGINYFAKLNPEREDFMQWHLRELSSRVINKLMNLRHKPDSATVTIAVYDPEQKTLSRMFQRVDCTPYMLQLQPRFLSELVPIHLKKW